MGGDLMASMNRQVELSERKAALERNLRKIEAASKGSGRRLDGEDGDATGEHAAADNSAGHEEGAAPPLEEENSSADASESVDSMIDRILARTNNLDDKIDHLLFHNHHDLAGTSAHYTPYGVQVLPNQKSKDSVDQKLKMIDYMHNLGGGYNPMLHTMLPYYLGQNQQDQGTAIPYQAPMRKLDQMKDDSDDRFQEYI